MSSGKKTQKSVQRLPSSEEDSEELQMSLELEEVSTYHIFFGVGFWNIYLNKF